MLNVGCGLSWKKANHAVAVTGWGKEGERDFFFVVNSYGYREPSVKVAPCVLLFIGVPGEIDLTRSTIPNHLLVPPAATCGGDAKGAPCKFPFDYRGKKYSACTGDDHHDGKEWCLTDDADHWGLCDCPSTCGGDANGAPCKFPFDYKGKKYSACTSIEFDKDWCYTDGELHWGYCDCS